MVFEPTTLHLRFRNLSATDVATDSAMSEPPDVAAPPDVDAFLCKPRASADPRMDEELGVLPGTRPVDPAGPLVIFLQNPEFGIPAPGYDHSLPDPGSWSVQPTTFGWIASVSPSTRSAGPRRAVQMLAGCLALTLPMPALALADAPASPPQPTGAPTSAPSKAPATSPAVAPTSSKAPVSPPAIVPAPASPSSPNSAPAPASDSGATPPAPQWTPGLMTPPTPRAPDNRALADAAWEGIDGFVVIVDLKGGKSLRGRIGAVQADTFTLIDSTEGQILVIPKSGVASVRAYVPPPIPTQTGGGLIAGGSVLTALGAPVFLTGVAFVAICPSCTYLHLPMLIVGGGAIGGGIPMISKGVKRRNAFQKVLQEHRVVPMVSRTPYHGWTGGLTFRF